MAKEKIATMQKVAHVTGFSVSTVSRVLNSHDFASDDTRDRVMKAAKNLGYVRLRRRGVSQPLTSLGKNHENMSGSDNIVLLAPETVLGSLESPDWIYRDVVPVLQRTAKENNFHLILSSYGPDDQWKPSEIAARNISGVLWMAHDREDLLARISKIVPAVVINDNTLWPPQTSVMCSNRMVLLKAIEHLHKLGHRRVGYFDVYEPPEKTSIHCRERLAAYREAIRRFDMDTDPELCILGKFGCNEHPEAVAKAMDRMIAMKSMPTAMVAPLRYSIEFLKETRQRSINVPEDMSIVALDNAPAAEWVDPSLTVIDCAFGRCAEVAVELLLEEKNTHRKYARTILMEPELIVRKSTAKHRF
jgi:DNA-binding LacI/PurR family transcriptional regulator